MRTAAIIITYNRIDILKQCIAAVLSQELKPQEIIVIDNNSSDGTKEWLSLQADLTVITQENTGCSGGVHTGLSYAYSKGYDWFWIMDDDTIPFPSSLKLLHQHIDELKNKGIKNLGYIGSKVIWKDGAPHLMNVPKISTFDLNGFPFNTFDEFSLSCVSSSSFVSLLVNRDAVERVGLPLKEFYIWCDDVEFTRRIVNAGFLGFYSSKSMVLHDTKINYGANIFEDEKANIWKYRYGIRNELFMVKQLNGYPKFLSKFLKRLFIFPYRIIKKRKKNRLAFIKVNFQATLSSLFFNPKADRL